METIRKYDGSSQVLVTGGAGFPGSHLCDRLMARGHHVICADNFFTGSKHNIEHLVGHPLFDLVRHDVTLPLFVEVDGIYHLACPASPVHYQHDPVQTTRTSVYGAINMLGLAKRTRARIFQASTSEVHGDPDCHPQPEGYRGHVNPIGPRSCQDEGKRWSSSSACRTAWSSGNCRSTTWRARPNSSTWSGSWACSTSCAIRSWPWTSWHGAPAA